MKWLLLFAIWVIVNCSSHIIYATSIEHNGHYIEKVFLPYVISFEKQCNCKIDVNMEFSIMLRWAGYCYNFLSPLDNRIVLIDSEYWEAHTDAASREVLIFHELGHCVLGRDHNLLIKGEVPASIMFPIVFSATTYTIHRDEYIMELFGPKKPKTCRQSFVDNIDKYLDLK